MKFIPTLFSTPMVQSILEGRKTKTRRVVKAEISPAQGEYPATWNYRFWAGSPFQSQEEQDPPRHQLVDGIGRVIILKCPYGQPGDILWVREEFYQIGHWEHDDNPKKKRKSGRQAWKFVPDFAEIKYSDNPPEEYRRGRHHKDPSTSAWHKRLARFMPKASCRIFLRVKSVRVERLQDITESDSKLEGVKQYFHTNGKCHDGYENYLDPAGKKYWLATHSFQSLWQSINGPESWNENPWVWVIEFERIEKPENFI